MSVYEYLFDVDKNKGVIVVDLPSGSFPICKGCRKDLNIGDSAYMPDIDRNFLFCRDCLLQGVINKAVAKVSSNIDGRNNVYFHGKIRFKADVGNQK